MMISELVVGKGESEGDPRFFPTLKPHFFHESTTAYAVSRRKISILVLEEVQGPRAPICRNKDTLLHTALNVWVDFMRFSAQKRAT